MSPELHQRVRKLFDQAMERPQSERLAFLEDECGGEPEVFREVKRLLDANLEAESFLEERPTHRSERIDRYLIKRELGRGAMGVVYEAVDPLIGRSVAIKVISIEATSPKEVEFMRDSLFREARSAGVLSHPGIVIIFDVGQENDTAFITMERVEGPTLDQVLESRGVPDPRTALDLLRQTAAALDYAHQCGVVHRDIKPANIMLHKGTVVKITDFGIAKISTAHSKTLTGMVMGTPSYMSPEQIETKPMDGRADQFSLGVVAFELLTGTKPFQGGLLGPLMHAIMFGERPSARALNPALPAGVDAVLERVLRRSPAERYATCAEFVSALEACFAARSPGSGEWRNAPTEMLPIVPVAAGPAVAAPPGTQGPVPPPPVVKVPPPPVAAQPGTQQPFPPPPVVPPPFPPPVPRPAGEKRGKPVLALVLAGVGTLVLAGGYLAYRFVIPHPDSGHGITGPPKNIGAAPVVSRFTAEPPAVEPGAATTLRWDVTGATEVEIDQGVGKVFSLGEKEVKPPDSTTYILTAKGPGGNSTARVSVEVKAPPKPPPKDLPPTKAPPVISFFRADPSSVRAGDRFRIDWSVKGASTVSIDHGVGTVSASGSQSLVADATATYTITATGEGGTRTSQVTVTVPVETAGELFDQAVAARSGGDPAKAASLFQRAATRGDARAMLELGFLYRNGNGVPKDVRQSVSWFEKAANAGNSSGMDYMGAMYANGEGVPKDDRQAMSWYSKAAAAGNPVGMDALGQMYRNGRGVAQNYVEAISWFKKSADAGNPSGMYHLGQMYENGWGVPRNLNEAMADYRKAAATGERDAIRHLGELERQPQQSTNQPGIRIAASVPWTDTGIDLKPGDQVTVAANGSIRVVSNGRMAPVSPAGVMSNCSAAASMYGRPAGAFPAPGLPCWSLLGRIGPAPRTPFAVGMNRSFRAGIAGRLYLGINDDEFSDNTGNWNAVINVTSGR